MKTLITSLFIIGGAVAVSACGSNYDGSPYFATGRTASHGGVDVQEKVVVAAPKVVRAVETAPSRVVTTTTAAPVVNRVYTPAAPRAERIFRSTQSK